jgi:hypothetical protein
MAVYSGSENTFQIMLLLVSEGLCRNPEIPYATFTLEVKGICCNFHF